MNDLIASLAAYSDSLIGGRVCVIIHECPGGSLGLGPFGCCGNQYTSNSLVVTIKLCLKLHLSKNLREMLWSTGKRQGTPVTCHILES